MIQLEGDGTTPANTGRFEAPPPEKAPTESTEKICACANIFIGLKGMNFLWGGGSIAANLLAPAVIMTLRTLAQRCKLFTPLLAAPAALLLSQGQAKAVLTYNIFESGGNVVVQTNGSLNLTGATPDGTLCFGTNGYIDSLSGVVNTGPNNCSSPAYVISGPMDFNGTVSASASSVSGIMTLLRAGTGLSRFSIDPTYVSATPIVSSATYNGTTLAGLGFTTTGLIGTWSLDGTSETINVFLGNSASAAVPGPVPLLGAGFAFGWSRRLRKRIAAPLITPPQV